MELEGLDHVALAVSDVEQAADWYVKVLGFERRYQGMWNGVPLFVGKGTTAIAFFPAKTQTKSAFHPPNRGMLHLAFRANRKPFLAAQKELKARGIEFEFQDHEISQSIYFYDPDGNAIEITTYELEQ